MTAQVRKVLQAPEVMLQAIREVVALDPAADAQHVILTLQSIEPVSDERFPAEQARIVQLFVERVTVNVKVASATHEPPLARFWEGSGVSN